MRFRCKFKQQQQQQPVLLTQLSTQHPHSRLTSEAAIEEPPPPSPAPPPPANPPNDSMPTDNLLIGSPLSLTTKSFESSRTHFEARNNVSPPGGQFSPAAAASPSSSGSPLASGHLSALRLVKRKPDSPEDLSDLSPKRSASSSVLVSSPSPNGSATSSTFDPEPRSRFERPSSEVYDERTKSAFQRVDKLLLPPSSGSKLSSALPCYVTMTSSILTPTTALNMAAMMDKGASASNASAMMAAAAGGLFVFPRFPPRGLPLPPLTAADAMHRFSRPSAANENAPYYAAAAAAAVAAAAAAANAAAMTGLQYMNNNNNNTSNNNNNNNTKALKLPSYISAAAAVDPGRLGPVPFFYRSPNPMVDKMLHVGSSPSSSGPIPSTFAALNLTQNWCAKCNTSFRMTSDLVYHMRSHHKREFDPVKKKKDDKLRCDVCGESFRERHHLTRHMTSHT